MPRRLQRSGGLVEMCCHSSSGISSGEQCDAAPRLAPVWVQVVVNEPSLLLEGRELIPGSPCSGLSSSLPTRNERDLRGC